MANFLYDAICILFRDIECAPEYIRATKSTRKCIFTRDHRDFSQRVIVFLYINGDRRSHYRYYLRLFCRVLFAIRRLPFWHRKMTSVANSLSSRAFVWFLAKRLSDPPVSHIPGRNAVLRLCPRFPPVIWSAIVSERAYGSLGGWSFAWWLTALCIAGHAYTRSYTCSCAASAH